MTGTVGFIASTEGVGASLVMTTFWLGVRHGVDWDHIAAITDLSSGQLSRARALLLASFYVLGHAVVVLMLGSVAVLAGGLLPARVDAAMERIVGATLVGFGLYVLFALVRDGRNFRLRSRWMILVDALERTARRRRARRTTVVEIVHDHPHDHDALGHGHQHRSPVASSRGALVDGPSRAVGRARVSAAWGHGHVHVHRGSLPPDPLRPPSKIGAWMLGMIHGIGAETPTQVVLFVAAARADRMVGETLLLVFVIGLVASNTAIAIAAAAGFGTASRSFPLYASIGVATGALSLAIGSLFLVGRASAMPALFGG